jgi:hypothetical protein
MNKKFLLLCILIVLALSIIYFTFYSSQEDYTIIVLPDTQKYSENYPEIFSAQTQWIADTEKEFNTVFVIHEGDIVDDWADQNQWARARNSMDLLEDIPFVINAGNHDRGTNKNLIYFEKYFPLETFREKEYWIDYWGGNSAQIIQVNNEKLLFVNLVVCPDENDLIWIDNIIQQVNHTKAILTTHAYLNLEAKRETHVCNSTENIWEMAKQHENLFLILSGHVHGEAYLLSYNDFNKPVHQMLADYQTEDNGGNGKLRLLHFVPSKNKLEVRTYSPFLEKNFSNPESHFDLELN